MGREAQGGKLQAQSVNLLRQGRTWAFSADLDHKQGGQA